MDGKERRAKVQRPEPGDFAVALRPAWVAGRDFPALTTGATVQLVEAWHDDGFWVVRDVVSGARAVLGEDEMEFSPESRPSRS